MDDLKPIGMIKEGFVYPSKNLPLVAFVSLHAHSQIPACQPATKAEKNLSFLHARTAVLRGKAAGLKLLGKLRKNNDKSLIRSSVAAFLEQFDSFLD